ncbi:MAG: DUF4403 family protein [Bacteroidota bacterium]|nr:DUF4403 family protein [Bacteroidota bacterium]
MKRKTIRNIILTLLTIFLIVVAYFFLTRVKIEPIPPVQTTLDTTQAIPLSELIFPVDFEVSELSTLLNTAISGKFFSASLNVNKRGDVVDLDITKSAPLKIKWQMPYLEMEVPLHLSGTGKVKIGRKSYSNKEPVEGDLILKLRTEISISSDWKLITKTRIKEIIWINDPFLKIAFIKVNLKENVDALMKVKETELTKNFDKAVSEKIELKRAITKIWMDIQKPIRINKKEVLVWLRSRCESISGQMIDKGPGTICIQVACYTKTQILFDTDTAGLVNVKLPPYTQSQKGLENKVELYIAAAIPFDLANRKMNERIKDIKFKYKGFAVKVKSIELYGTDSAIALKLNLGGHMKGDVYFTGKVYYDSITNKIGINKIKYDVNTENALLQTADWFLHDSLPGIMEKRLKIPLDSLTDRIPLLMDKGIEDSKVGHKLDANISIENISLHKILITKRNIQIIALAKAKGGIVLDKSAFNKNIKPIRITKVKPK